MANNIYGDSCSVELYAQPLIVIERRMDGLID